MPSKTEKVKKHEFITKFSGTFSGEKKSQHEISVLLFFIAKIF
jgi:hypothetical protein